MRLSWEPSEFNQLSVLRIPANKVWLPDIVLYNKYVYSNPAKYCFVELKDNFFNHIKQSI
jgi:Neurotransmitter-gated ion-channel ligand binding domain